jgi:hypothetical protein
MRNWLCIAPLILLAGCSRSDKVQPQSASVGYAPASSAVTRVPAADTVVSPDPQPRVIPVAMQSLTIPSGTALHVRLDQAVDTKRNRAGDRISATLMTPVVVNGRTVIPAGTPFAGHVTEADSSGRLKGRARIGVALDSFRLNGHQYAISTASADRVSQKHKKRNGILIGGGAGVGAAIGALAGGGTGALIGGAAGAGAGTAGAAATGKLEVSIPAETPLTFTLRTPLQM